MVARHLTPGFFTLLLALGACTGTDKGDAFGNGGDPHDPPGGNGGGGSEGGDDTGIPSGDDTGGTGGGEEGGEGGGDDTSGGDDTNSTDDSSGGDDTNGSGETSGTFDDPGDVVSFEDSDGLATVDLSDATGESNQNQEFYMVVVNTTEDDITWRLRYTDEGHGSDSGPGRPKAPAGAPGHRVSPMRSDLREAVADGRLARVAPPAAPPPALGVDDIGTTVREFRVRNDIDDDSTYTLVDGTLWAVGSSVALWVDNDLPIDWDYECDGIIDEEATYDAYGFDNCDLQTIADIVDTNIFPNISATFGDVSDVNGDGLVSVVITPVLNVIPLTSDDEDDWGTVMESYADPEVDLTTWDADDNPGSDEQEVLYVFAPDPYGAYNPLATTTVDEYTSMTLAAQIARAYMSLVSYNQHVLEYEGESEEDWMNNALGALAADLVGFGAVYYDDAWDYLDAPYLYSLVDDSDDGSLSTDTIGAQYLFARWLADTYGLTTLSAAVQTSDVGVDAVEAATGEDFTDLVVRWQVALLTTGVTRDGGESLVRDSDYSPFNDAAFISAPTSDPSTGDNYGANGYQTGVNIRGVNYFMEDGTTDAPSEIEDNRITLSNTDHYNHVTGLEYYGYIAANYGAQVVRLADAPYAGTGVELQGSDSGFAGAIVRWNNPTTPDFAVEDIFSPTDANNLELPALPADGSPVYGLGSLSESGLTVVVNADGDEENADVTDTDRWLIDLSEFSSGEDVSVAIWLDHRYDENGDASPGDPWMAVVPSTYVPTPSVDGTNNESCTDGVEFAYPATILEYLYAQVFLASTPYSDEDDDFDACGTASESSTTCDQDWDRDGVLDDDEPQPENFLQQVRVMQCTLADGDSTAYTALTSDIFDTDTTDDDDEAEANKVENLGGVSAEDTEGAFVNVTLTGGGSYLLVVGDVDGASGTYELTLQARTADE